MDGDLGKLRWRCRRGMKELDLLLTRYADEQYRDAAPAQQLAFRQLLDVQDPLLYDYFVGRATPPNPELSSLVERITAQRPNDR
jgi:antitoxin CptB